MTLFGTKRTLGLKVQATAEQKKRTHAVANVNFQTSMEPKRTPYA